MVMRRTVQVGFGRTLPWVETDILTFKMYNLEEYNIYLILICLPSQKCLVFDVCDCSNKILIFDPNLQSRIVN